MMNSFRGTVYVDERNDSNLVNFKKGTYKKINMEILTHSKSEEEKKAFKDMTNVLRSSIDDTTDGTKFRGSVDSQYKTVYSLEKKTGFTQYRAGLCDSVGRVSEIADIKDCNDAWKKRLLRTYRGLSAYYSIKSQSPIIKFEEHNVVDVKCCIGSSDGKEVAMIFRGPTFVSNPPVLKTAKQPIYKAVPPPQKMEHRIRKAPAALPSKNKVSDIKLFY